ncbi:sodium:solute symporter family protein [Myxococcota bacterium]|nr:sodium:solute symporter family protein [Myxococcota bacterium]
MNFIDLIIVFVYLSILLGVGVYFLRKNQNAEDYFVGGRRMGALHVGLSVVATDVGGGFSIGLGGLGFMMGLSGAWMLFTGLVGAWLSAVLLIPRVFANPRFRGFTTFPQILGHFFDARVAVLAGVISAIGYIGFTSSQILAGAKLASASFPGLDMRTALLIMGLIVVFYTALGGIKAVIYTDTIQWIVLMLGLIFIGLPMGWVAIGGWDAIATTLEPEMVSLTNIGWATLVNWAFTIIPIWFVGMTLYQRIYACRDERTARRAWFIAGLFEWPVMAFMGVTLGLFARVAAEQGAFSSIGYATSAGLDPEMGLPLFLRTILPAGLLGLMMSAYFSAIMSTADSCLMAASGNVATDLIDRIIPISRDEKRFLRLCVILTFVLGAFALLLASFMENVLALMLYSYAFMVSGLLVPVLGGFFWRPSSPAGALGAMLAGGGTTLTLILLGTGLPYGLDPNLFGITASLIVFVSFSLLLPRRISDVAGAPSKG